MNGFIPKPLGYYPETRISSVVLGNQYPNLEFGHALKFEDADGGFGNFWGFGVMSPFLVPSSFSFLSSYRPPKTLDGNHHI